MPLITGNILPLCRPRIAGKSRIEDSAAARFPTYLFLKASIFFQSPNTLQIPMEAQQEIMLSHCQRTVKLMGVSTGEDGVTGVSCQ